MDLGDLGAFERASLLPYVFSRACLLGTELSMVFVS